MYLDHPLENLIGGVQLSIMHNTLSKLGTIMSLITGSSYLFFHSDGRICVTHFEIASVSTVVGKKLHLLSQSDHQLYSRVICMYV